MAGIVVYPRVSDGVIRKSVDKLLKQIPAFFAANPGRDDCVLEFYYGKIVAVTPKNFREEVEAVAAECIKQNAGD